MTSRNIKNIPTIFNNIIATNRQPKELGDYDYIDISYNTLYDLSSNIIYDISNNIKFYNINYYYPFLINCVNYVPIITEKGNYIYLFLVNLLFNNIPICKIGYTSDILERTITLKKHSKIEMKLLAIMPIKGEFQEIILHSHLKIKYNYCIMDYKYPNGSNATELYKFHPLLISELYNFVKHLENINKNTLLIKQEETKQIEYIETTKQEQEKTKQEQEKTKQEQEKTKQEKTKQEIEKEKTKQEIEKEKTKQEIEKEKTKQLELIFKTKQLELKIEKIKLKK